MPNYLFEHPEGICEITEAYGYTFHYCVPIAECDRTLCPACRAPLVRKFEGCTNFRYEHLSNSEKAIKRDLIENNNLEKQKAYGGIKTYEDRQRIDAEITKLKFTK